MSIDSIELDVDLDLAQVNAKLEKLEAKLKQLDETVSIDLDLDNYEQIKQQIKQLEDDIDLELDGKVNELDIGEGIDIEGSGDLKTASQLLDDMELDFDIQGADKLHQAVSSLEELDIGDLDLPAPDEGGDDDDDDRSSLGPDTGGRNMGFGNELAPTTRALGDAFPLGGGPNSKGELDSFTGGFPFDPRVADVAGDSDDPSFKPGLGLSLDIPDSERETNKERGLRTVRKGLDKLRSVAASTGATFSRLKPTFGKFFQILALLAPVLASAAAQAAGLAVAFGAIGAAGGSIIGLGLLGKGGTLKEALKNSKEKVKELKQALFQTFQGPAQLFEPIQAQFFDFIPRRLRPVADAMEGLTAFGPTLFELFDIVADGATRLINAIVLLEDEMSQVGVRFTKILVNLIVDGLIGLFEWAYKNQNMLIRLGEAAYSVIRAIFLLSTFITELVLAFKPLIEFVAGIARLFQNRLVKVIAIVGLTLMSLVGILYALGTAILFVSGASLPAMISGFLQALGAVYGLIASMPALISELLALQLTLTNIAALVTVITGGLAALGAIALGGMALADTLSPSAPKIGRTKNLPGGGPRGGRGAGVTGDTITNITIEGDADQGAMERLQDQRRVANQEYDIRQSRNMTTNNGS